MSFRKKGKIIVFLLIGSFCSVGQAQTSEQIFEQGYQLYEKGNYNKAIELYNEAIDLDRINNTSDYIKYYNIGLNYSLIDSFQLSNFYLDTCINLHPYLEQAFGERGLNYMFMDMNEKAIENFNAAIRLNPKSLSRYNRGYVYYTMGEYENALKDFTKYLMYDSNHYKTFVLSAHCKAMLKDIEGAEKYLQWAKDIDSEHHDILEAEIWIEANRKKIDKEKLFTLIKKLELYQKEDYSYVETIGRFGKIVGVK